MQAMDDLMSLEEQGPVLRWGFGINTRVTLACSVRYGMRQAYTVTINGVDAPVYPHPIRQNNPADGRKTPTQ